MKAYKGFNPDMTCRGFQYEEGKKYETDKAELCNEGFHACERPLDIIQYYPFVKDGKLSKFHEVELEEVSDQRANDDTKVVAKRIKVGAELNLFELVKAQFEYVKAHTTMEHTDPSAASAGYKGAAASKGRSSVGENGIACARGNGCQVKGGMGAVLVIAEENADNYDIKSWKAFVIDGEKYKPDTWYTLKGGKIVEVTE